VPNNALADTGPLVASFDRGDPEHQRARRFLSGFEGNLITTWPVLTEVCHLLPRHVVERFMTWAGAGGLVVYEMPPDTLHDLHALMQKYANLPMDLADASLVWLAGAVGLFDIVTLDDRDFTVYRTAAGKPFRNLLPPS
jgi:hypothetical protein